MPQKPDDPQTENPTPQQPRSLPRISPRDFPPPKQTQKIPLTRQIPRNRRNTNKNPSPRRETRVSLTPGPPVSPHATPYPTYFSYLFPRISQARMDEAKQKDSCSTARSYDLQHKTTRTRPWCCGIKPRRLPRMRD